MMRILVTGSRHATPEDGWTIWQMLDVVALARPGQQLAIVHGHCPVGGADAYADSWALQHPDATPERHPAEEFGPWPACGPRRNSHMVDLGAALCLGFPDPRSKGTWDCLRKAEAAGIPTHVVNLPGTRVVTFPCPTRRCGQPLPVDVQPGDRCLACGEPIKPPRKVRAA